MGFSVVRTPFPIYVHTEEEIITWVEYFEMGGSLGFDTETTGLDTVRDRVRFFSAADEHVRICAPVRLLEAFRPLLEDSSIEKRMSNSKYDRHMVANHGILVRGHVQDTIDQDFLLDENRLSHGLKETSWAHLGLRMTPFKKVFGSAGTTNDEVRTLCEIHDVLELHDHEGKVDKARKWALRILVRLSQTSLSPEEAKDFRKVELAMKAGGALTARQILVIARKYGFAPKTTGPKSFVSDFLVYLGGDPLQTRQERNQWEPLLEDKLLLGEAHEILLEQMLSLMDVNEDPVEFLRNLVADYASLDAWASFMLTDHLREQLEQEEMITEDVLHQGGKAETLLDHSEVVRVPFMETLWYMERRGFKIDVGLTKTYGIDMLKTIQRAEREIVRVTRIPDFNANSVPQLREAIFTKDRNGEWVDPFGEAPKKFTDGGASGKKMPSTGAEVLEEFAGKGHELSALILEQRQYSKLHGTYMEALPKWADRNGRIHTSLKSIGARTWRLASANPNL